MWCQVHPSHIHANRKTLLNYNSKHQTSGLKFISIKFSYIAVTVVSFLSFFVVVVVCCFFFLFFGGGGGGQV